MIAHLPTGWRAVRLGDCLNRRRDTVLPSSLSNKQINIVGLENIEDGGRGGVTVRKAEPTELASLKMEFKKGDILYGKLRPYLNKVAIAPVDGYCSTEIWALCPLPFVDTHFVRAFLSSEQFVRRVASRTKGANLPRLDSRSFDSIEIPLPLPSEQKRISDIFRHWQGINSLGLQAESSVNELSFAAFHSIFGQLATNSKNWPIVPVRAFVSEFEGGKSLPDEGSDVPGRARVLKISAVTSGRFDPTESKSVPSGYEPPAHHFVKRGDLLISRANTEELVAATAYVDECPPNILLSDKLSVAEHGPRRRNRSRLKRIILEELLSVVA